MYKNPSQALIGLVSQLDLSNLIMAGTAVIGNAISGNPFVP
jgi:hypothetical protein